MTESPKCPVNEPECCWLGEVADLQQQVGLLSDELHTDLLTGLFNFRHLQLVLEQEMERTRRTGRPTSLLVLDLDYFKRLNDTYGHEAGNQVLIHVAQLIKGELRKLDIPCRYGGEEFVLIMPDTPLPRAVGVAERLREVIADMPTTFDGKSLTTSVSIGADVCSRRDNITPEDLIKLADRQLYRAKESGRNRVCHRDFGELRPAGQVSQEEKGALFGGEKDA
ncbi:MAG: GGDEF domain-containing protein [Gammaproteobacteria bacterium]|nr:GGDEF domain-containing protein [Gammaproteobacteria bacterium]